MSTRDDFVSARERMVDHQLVPRRITDERVLSAMRSVPRHLFVPSDLHHMAYADAPLPIGHHQTISQPYIVALMTQLLELGQDATVLEVGTGSGYQAAILAQIAAQVYTVERISELASQAQRIFDELGLNHIRIFECDGSAGLPEYAPYEAIIVTAAAPKVPQPLKSQLKDGGRLVLPVGSRDGQMLERWHRKGEEYEHERIAPVAFVPLLGNHGWDNDAGPYSWWR